MDSHFEHEHKVHHLDESFSHIGGGHMGGGGVRPMGGGGVRPMGGGGVVRVGGGIKTPQQIHNRMVGNFYRQYPYGGYGRRYVISPYGLNWFGAGVGYLYGYPYEFLYPLFYDLQSGIYDEYSLKTRYTISDADWNRLMLNLIRGGYISAYDY